MKTKLKEQESIENEVATLRILVSQLKRENQNYEEQIRLLTSVLSSQKEYDC